MYNEGIRPPYIYVYNIIVIPISNLVKRFIIKYPTAGTSEVCSELEVSLLHFLFKTLLVQLGWHAREFLPIFAAPMATEDAL